MASPRPARGQGAPGAGFAIRQTGKKGRIGNPNTVCTQAGCFGREIKGEKKIIQVMTSLELRVGGAGGIYIDRRVISGWYLSYDSDRVVLASHTHTHSGPPISHISLSLTSLKRVCSGSSSRPHHKTLSSSSNNSDSRPVLTDLGNLNRTRTCTF